MLALRHSLAASDESSMTAWSRQRAAWFVAACVGAGAATFALRASASDIYDYDPSIPNGAVNTCLTCHTTLEGIDLNSFGWDVQNHKAGDGIQPDWLAVCGLDSDLDGQTNGQELGDPCCEWQPGQPAPRTTAISNPGEATDLSTDPDSPGCSTEDDDGGCAVAGRPRGAAASVTAGLLGLGLWWGRRRGAQRRRRRR